MKAIETTGTFQKTGLLKLDKSIAIKGNKKVRVIILYNDDYDISEKEWLNSVSKNPDFNFLNEPEEDIYSLKDGKPLKK